MSCRPEPADASYVPGAQVLLSDDMCIVFSAQICQGKQRQPCPTLAQAGETPSWSRRRR